MKPKIILVIIALITLSFSCGKEDSSPTGPENTVPELNVNTSSLSFSIDNDEAMLIITNVGDGELSWEIVGKPDWIDISKLSGQITNEADTVTITANTELDIGDYSGEISINSNGGTATVNVSLSIETKIGIFPGEGAARMDLGDTYSQLKQVYGNPDNHIVFEIYYPNDGHYEYWHNLYYYSIKATFVIFGYSSSILDSDSLISITVEYPYDGQTEELIGIGSSLADVVVAYGEPPEIITGYTYYYKYESLGINFYHAENDSIVTKIKVYYPG